MASYGLSSRAETDLAEIADYSFNNFGVEQAVAYGKALDSCFRQLATSPLAGTDSSELAPKLRSFECGSHVVFYTPIDQGVFIVRVLHCSMDFRRHL